MGIDIDADVINKQLLENTVKRLREDFERQLSRNDLYVGHIPNTQESRDRVKRVLSGHIERLQDEGALPTGGYNIELVVSSGPSMFKRIISWLKCKLGRI